MSKQQVQTDGMIEALRDGLHGLHIARMMLVEESKALRMAGRRTERDRMWARVKEITAQIETTNRELAEHMLRAENARWKELMPCPFCGGVAKHMFGTDEHLVECTVCGAAGHRPPGAARRGERQWVTGHNRARVTAARRHLSGLVRHLIGGNHTGRK